MEPSRTMQVSTQEKVDKLYEAWVPNLRTLILNKYGEEFCGEVIPEVEVRYRELTLDLPNIGGDANPLTNTLIRSALWLAVYQVVKSRGKNVFSVGEMIYEDFSQATARFTPEQMQKFGEERFSHKYIDEQKRLALISQKREFEGDWEFSIIDGDGSEFDYGVDYTTCGICTFYHKHGADELAQFICLTDFYTSEAMGLGLERTQTIADGFDVCNFRYKRGRETKLNWAPDFLKR